MKYHFNYRIEQIEGEIYKKFIKIAVKYSDTCSFELYDLPSKESFKDMYDLIVNVVNFPDAYEGYEKRIICAQSESLLKGIYHILDNYNIRIPFTKLLLLHEIKNDHTTKTLKFIKICDEVETLLLFPNSLLAWGSYKYPDNLCFYNNGVKWFVSEQHEFGMRFNLEMLDEAIAKELCSELNNIKTV